MLSNLIIMQLFRMPRVNTFKFIKLPLGTSFIITIFFLLY